MLYAVQGRLSWQGFAYIADRLSKGLRERPWLKEPESMPHMSNARDSPIDWEPE